MASNLRSPNNANLKKHFTHIPAAAAMIFSIRTPVLISKLVAISIQSSSINIKTTANQFQQTVQNIEPDKTDRY